MRIISRKYGLTFLSHGNGQLEFESMVEPMHVQVCVKSSANAFYYQKLGFIAACYRLLSRVYETEEQVCRFRISGDPWFHRAVLACPDQILTQQLEQRYCPRIA